MNIEPCTTRVSDTAWIKSSYSGGNGGECVEVAASTASVHIRDSKDRGRPSLTVGRTEWAAFLRFACR
jgi:hypothetical protein